MSFLINRIRLGWAAFGKPRDILPAEENNENYVSFFHRIEQDVGLGKNVGFQTLLVLTHFSEQEMRVHKIKPDFFAPALGHLVPKLKMLLK